LDKHVFLIVKYYRQEIKYIITKTTVSVKITRSYSAQTELFAKCLSSPNDYIGDPWLKIWIPDYTLGNDNFLVTITQDFQDKS